MVDLERAAEFVTEDEGAVLLVKKESEFGRVAHFNRNKQVVHFTLSDLKTFLIRT